MNYKNHWIVLGVSFLALWPLGLSSAQWGPVWEGPRQVRWQGIGSTPAEPSSQAPVVRSDVPRWVGYVKRSRDEWWFRLILADGKSEMVKRAGMTSDGWTLSSFSAQANRPTSITLSKDGKDEILQLTPQ